MWSADLSLAAYFTVAPANIFIPEGSSLPSRAPTVKGVAGGAAVVNVSAYGYTSAIAQVLVTSNLAPLNPGLRFSPSAVTISGIATQNLTLVLSSPAPAGGLAVSVVSSNAGVAGAPSTVTFAGGQAPLTYQ